MMTRIPRRRNCEQRLVLYLAKRQAEQDRTFRLLRPIHAHSHHFDPDWSLESHCIKVPGLFQAGLPAGGPAHHDAGYH